MQTAQFGGQLGQFKDPATGNVVSGRVFGSFNYQSQQDVSNVIPMVQQALVNAAGRVIAQKVMSNQVAVPTLAQSLPHFAQEIIAQNGAAQYGVQITQLDMQVQVAGGAMPQQPPPPQQMPPTPQQAMQKSLAQQAQERLDPSNYNVKAKLKIGGFNINASSQDGLDTQGLMNQAKDKVKTNLIWYGVGCVIVGIVLIGLAGLGWYIYSQAQAATSGTGGTPATRTAKAAAWDGKTPFSCSGNQHVKLDGVTANIASGTAVTASANCVLEISNCNITAPTGIESSANAKVTVTGGSVTGTKYAAKASALSHITFSGTKVTGKTKKSGAAKIVGP